MSSLWTPSGEHFPSREEGGGGSAGSPGSGPPPSGPPPSSGPGDVEGDGSTLSAEAQAELDAMRQQLSQTPAEVVVANHCYGIFELATIYLSNSPPMFFEARLAIDALGGMLEAVKGRLGEAEPSLLQALSQLRLAYVQLEGAERAAAESAASADQN